MEGGVRLSGPWCWCWPWRVCTAEARVQYLESRNFTEPCSCSPVMVVARVSPHYAALGVGTQLTRVCHRAGAGLPWVLVPLPVPSSPSHGHAAGRLKPTRCASGCCLPVPHDACAYAVLGVLFVNASPSAARSRLCRAAGADGGGP